MNYRIAQDGYNFGKTKKRRGMLKIMKGKTEKHKCKYCRINETVHHVFAGCTVTLAVLRDAERILGLSPAKKDMILINKLNSDGMILTLISIYKKTVLTQKQHLDIENNYMEEEKK